MQTLNHLRRDLPETGPLSDKPRHSLHNFRQPTFSRKDIHRSSLFTRNPDYGPAVQQTPITTHPTKRSETALDPALYLPQTSDNFYGRFITLGYHHSSGPLNNPLLHRGERNKTFELWKRVKPNGWKFIVDERSGQQATTVLSSAARERLRTMSLNTPVGERGSTSIRVTSVDRPNLVVEYTLIPSQDHDLFQFGRDPYNNDFHIPGHTIEGHTWYSPPFHLFYADCDGLLGGVDVRDPVSRLAFRVQCCRSNPLDLKIAAAGFDYANELFLGPFALRWDTQAEGGPAGGLDGGITVGLYIWKPHNTSEEITGDWYEVSALGELYHLRVGGQRGRKAKDVNNTLTDGCIIVNANSVLLFTTSPPSKDDEFLTPEILAARLSEIKDMLCPITYDTLTLRNNMISNAGHTRPGLIPPSHLDPIHSDPLSSAETDSDIRRAGVFPSCGHVFELPPPSINARLTNCPKCRSPGHMIPLLLQTAPTFMRRDEEFTHVLPCGHAVSERLGKRMAGVGMPSNDLLVGETESKDWGDCLIGRRRRCWFCGTGFWGTDLRKLYFEIVDSESWSIV